VSSDSAVWPREVDFRREQLRKLLHDPLEPTAVYWFALFSVVFVAVVLANHLDAPLPSYAAAAAWLLYGAYCITWTARVVSTLRHVTDGAVWFAIANPEELGKN
jgi:hypothetical protein